MTKVVLKTAAQAPTGIAGLTFAVFSCRPFSKELDMTSVPRATADDMDEPQGKSATPDTTQTDVDTAEKQSTRTARTHCPRHRTKSCAARLDALIMRQQA